jgi:hypothetical protein
VALLIKEGVALVPIPIEARVRERRCREKRCYVNSDNGSFQMTAEADVRSVASRCVYFQKASGA